MHSLLNVSVVVIHNTKSPMMTPVTILSKSMFVVGYKADLQLIYLKLKSNFKKWWTGSYKGRKKHPPNCFYTNFRLLYCDWVREVNPTPRLKDRCEFFSLNFDDRLWLGGEEGLFQYDDPTLLCGRADGNGLNRGRWFTGPHIWFLYVLVPGIKYDQNMNVYGVTHH